MSAYKKKWYQLATWRKGSRRHGRMVRRINAAKCMKEHHGTLMNLLGEVVVDLYEEIHALRTRGAQDQTIILEFYIRLDQAMTLSEGPEWDKIRESGSDALELSLVCCNAWFVLFNRCHREYTDLDGIQANLRAVAKSTSSRIQNEVRRQGMAFLYRLS
jgi:hypothetical protein